MEPFLCNGHMILLPQSSGILPEVNILLKTIVKYGIESSLVHLKNSAGIPSGPGDLLMCK